MNTPTRIAAFAVGLVAVFGAAVGVGSAVGPVGTVGGSTGGGHGDGGHAAAPAPATVPGGLQVSQDGYTLALASGTAAAGPSTEVAFRVLGPDGSPVTAYETDHDVDLHLVAVRRDLTGYQHVHPDLGDDGVWRAPLALEPGSWRLFADFTAAADGENRVLGADLAVPGAYDPAPLPAPSQTAQVDGYTVVLTGGLTPGEESELTLSVSRDGAPVTDLQPYLGAYGHLVALRDGDLAHLHVHPAGRGGTQLAPGPHIPFATTAPSAGAYRLFLDFRHGDAVHTAAFTVTAEPHEEHGS
ncbi:hypothetical protein E9549_02505 [Blastococcus sp. MG754426]|uniref:DUF748 domain-containing protein n=1 Tax=unclassified Blastococcus TaxID=2619396 RepID=UPI001EF08732|nr:MULTISPECIES: DUF748 domain-containing protein [unclassified Blastococcus]MCF6506282.1 hypothetical protein [Blastococcus sp. MG754426]MCF6510902.1 hypothetical protein [Blastococcus sp. MG754427]MCF6733868.1 hypothetical protein [Blastococcus sp. KM273129]